MRAGLCGLGCAGCVGWAVRVVRAERAGLCGLGCAGCEDSPPYEDSASTHHGAGVGEGGWGGVAGGALFRL